MIKEKQNQINDNLFLTFITHYFNFVVCRHCILYHLQLRPPFPNDGKILKPKAGLESNQIISWLEEGFYGKYNFFYE